MIAKTLRENLVALAKAYAKATGTTLTAASKKFYGNAGFFQQFGAGQGSISIDKYDAIVAAIQCAWPKEAEWPFLRAVVIERPKKK